MNSDEILNLVRTVPGFPKAGIMFKDITTLLVDAGAFRKVMDSLVARYRGRGLTKVVGIESRGFIFGAPLAYALGIGFVVVRKLGKLPGNTIKKSYELEYGTATLELHDDAITANDRVLIVDDLLATGGTLAAAIDLCRTLGATVEEAWVLIELSFLNGRDVLDGVPLHAEAVVRSE